MIRRLPGRRRAPHRGAARRSGRAASASATRRIPAAIATPPIWSPASSASATSRSRCRPIRRSIRTARRSRPTSTCSRPRSMPARRARSRSSSSRTISTSAISTACARAASTSRSCRASCRCRTSSRPKSFAARCGASVPGWLAERFDGLDDDVATRKLIAAAVAAEQVLDLVDRGVTDFHFYTMNRADLVYAICHLLGPAARDGESKAALHQRSAARHVPSVAPSKTPADRLHPRRQLALRERILVLDGAMGTMIQALKLDEEGYRGARFDAWNREVRGNNDLLNLTRPDAIRDIHLAYFRAGADIVATNTFSSTVDRAGRLRHGEHRLRAELRGRAARARGGERAPRARTAGRASSPARSARPTAPPRSRRTSPIPASAPSPSTSCARPMASRCAGCSTAAPTCC